MKITRSKTGIPCLWENGGGNSNSGDATVIAAKNGAPKKAIYVARGGHLSNGQHALIPVHVGDYIVSASHRREDWSIRIERIESIPACPPQTPPSGWIDPEDKLTTKLVNSFDRGEWDSPLDENLVAAVDAAKNKATCYHCREPHYIAVT